MDPVDLVPSGYRFVPTAEELVVDYLANWIAGTPSWPRCRLRRRLRHRAVESSRQRSAGGLFLRSASPRPAVARASIERPAPVLASEQKARTRQVHRRRARDRGGKKELPSFKDGRRKNSGWVMYEYEMCSSTFETRVLCHVKKSSYQPISGGKFMKSVESTFTEAATETLTGGSSFVGQKRNREESSTLISSTQEAMPGVGCTFQRSIPVRPLTTSDRGGATALIGSRRDNPGESSFLHRLRGTERSRSPSRHPIVNGRWWR
ncbi:unnamed protein product [Musa acuminata subsp. burmannicoides]